MPRSHPTSQSGFTLLEMSIVLVIITFIAATVVIGKTSIESASLQTVVADFDRYRKAALDYRERYLELPGDHSGATAITSADGSCPTPAASLASTTATCNGNGNGIIGDSTGDPLGAFTAYGETLQFWQHLANVQLILGKYNGRHSTASTEISIGINVPQSKVDGGSFSMRYFPTNTTSGNYFKNNYGHVFFFGKPGASAAYPFNGAALTTDQAKSIDQKIDDGKPGLGKVITSPASVTSCATSSAENTAAYNNSITTVACALIFITGF